MGFGVKNTTLHELFEIVCPHYCMGCGELGTVLCERCKKYNNYEDMDVCLNCGVTVKNGHCGACKLPYDRGYAVGAREGTLQRCIGEYKYMSVRALKRPLAELMEATLPCLPKNVVVVPVPTNYRHVRMRGLDHTLLMARELAKMRGWKYERLVERIKDSVQVGADEETRRRQAKEAYGIGGKVDSEKLYVVMDDVWTTGSTMKAVCDVLRRAGARDITAIVLARA